MYECIIWVFCESIFVLLYQLIFTKTYDDGWLNGARAQHMLFFIGFILILFFLLASRTIRSRLPMLLFFSIFGSLCSKIMLYLKKKYISWLEFGYRTHFNFVVGCWPPYCCFICSLNNHFIHGEILDGLLMFFHFHFTSRRTLIRFLVFTVWYLLLLLLNFIHIPMVSRDVLLGILSVLCVHECLTRKAVGFCWWIFFLSFNFFDEKYNKYVFISEGCKLLERYFVHTAYHHTVARRKKNTNKL